MLSKKIIYFQYKIRVLKKRYCLLPHYFVGFDLVINLLCTYYVCVFFIHVFGFNFLINMLEKIGLTTRSFSFDI